MREKITTSTAAETLEIKRDGKKYVLIKSTMEHPLIQVIILNSKGGKN